MLCMLRCFICVHLFVTLLTVSHQVSLSIGFSRQEYWSGLPCPPPGDLPNPGIIPVSLISPSLAGKFFTMMEMSRSTQMSRSLIGYIFFTALGNGSQLQSAGKIFLPGKSHGRQSLVGYLPWGCKESDMTERLHFHFKLTLVFPELRQ